MGGAADETDQSGTKEKGNDGYEIRMKPYEGFNYPYEFTDDIAGHLRNIRDMEIKDDDVFITSYPKSGTHWIYEIVYMLLHDRSYCRQHHLLDIDNIDDINNAPSPRIIMTHIPIDRLPWQLTQGRAKVIYMTRNPKDVIVSYFCFVKRLAKTAFDGEFNNAFLEKFLYGKVPYDSWFRSVLSWERFPQTNPKVPFLMMNYEDMKSNLRQQVERVSLFLGQTIDGDTLDAITDKCSFVQTQKDKRENPDSRFNSTMSRDGPEIIYRKGEVGDWKNWFTVADNEKFDQIYKEKMSQSKLSFRFSL